AHPKAGWLSRYRKGVFIATVVVGLLVLGAGLAYLARESEPPPGVAQPSGPRNPNKPKGVARSTQAFELPDLEKLTPLIDDDFSDPGKSPFADASKGLKARVHEPTLAFDLFYEKGHAVMWFSPWKGNQGRSWSWFQAEAAVANFACQLVARIKGDDRGA